MKRLTKRGEYGNVYIIALDDIMPELYAELSFSETNALTEALNRLAAYEDTGLLPEDCAEYKKFEDTLVSSGKSFQYVLELLEAECVGKSLAEREGKP